MVKPKAFSHERRAVWRFASAVNIHMFDNAVVVETLEEAVLVGDSWLDDDDEDDDFISPLDNVETLRTFYSDYLISAFERVPAFFQEVQAMLAPETLSTCQNLFHMADNQPQAK